MDPFNSLSFKKEKDIEFKDTLVTILIDNSGSMRDEQRALGDNFEAFINEFVKKDIDFKMAITTTDTTRNNNGREWKTL